MREPTPRRRISELYSLGIPLTLDDGDTDWVPKFDDNNEPVMRPILNEINDPVLDEDGTPMLKQVFEEIALPPVHVWVAKLSDIEMTTAMKKAAQAQSVMIAARKDHDSTDWQAIRQEMANMDRDVWIGILADVELLGRREIIEARIAGEPILNDDGEEEPNEWAQDGYLEGLREAWLGGLNAEFAIDVAHPEAARVFAEIERFNKIVDDELEYERTCEVDIFEALGDDMLLDKVSDQMIESEGQSAWSDEYKLRAVFLASRQCDGPDPDRPGKCLCRGSGRKHTDFLFESYEEVASTDKKVRDLLFAAYNMAMVDVREGKGSRETAPSSAPSKSPAAEGTSASSGPTVATA